MARSTALLWIAIAVAASSVACNPESTKSNQRAKAMFDRAQSLVRQYHGDWSNPRNSPDVRIRGLNALYDAVPIFKQISEEFPRDEVYGKNAKIAYANYKDWYAKETEAREKVPDFIEKFQGRFLRDSPQLLEEVKEIQHRYGGSNTFFKNLADIREKLEREAPMATGQDMIKYDRTNTGAQRLLRDKSFGEAVKIWDEYHDSVTDPIYATKSRQKRGQVVEKARAYFQLISKRAANTGNPIDAKELLLPLEQQLLGTGLESELAYEISKYVR